MEKGTGSIIFGAVIVLFVAIAMIGQQSKYQNIVDQEEAKSVELDEKIFPPAPPAEEVTETVSEPPDVEAQASGMVARACETPEPSQIKRRRAFPRLSRLFRGRN